MVRKITFLIAAFVAAVACNGRMPVQEEISVEQEQASFVPGVAEVLLSEADAAVFGTKASASVFDELGVVSLERIFPDAGEFEARHREFGLDRWYRVVYDRNVSLTKASESLSALPGVEAVNMPRKKKHCNGTFHNDKYYDWQWNLFNDGEDGARFTAGADIDVEPVWRKYTCGKPEVVVAVIDGGVDMSHEDLRGVVLKEGEGGSLNTIEGYSSIVPEEHGTHVAGIIGAVSGNGKGIAGVAGGKDGKGGVTLMSCQIFMPEDHEDADLQGDSAEAMVWAADNGALIANNSWGYVYDSASDARKDEEWFRTTKNPDRSAIDYFIKYAGCDASGRQTGLMKGGVVIFAAGNEGWKYAVPAMYDKVIAVGSFDPDYSVSAYSNYGDWVDICAPGGADDDDYDTWPYIISTVPAPDEYVYMCGTSMSAPHVSGVAALLVSYYGGPGFTAAQLTERLLGGSRQGYITTPGKYIGGVLDAYGAFTYGDNPGSPIKITTDYDGDYVLKSHETLTVEYKISGNENGRYRVEFESSTSAAYAETLKDKVTMTIDALRAQSGSYTARIIVGRGTDAEASYPISFEILQNHEPVVVDYIPDMVLDASGTDCTLDLGSYFDDADGEVLKYKVSTDALDGVQYSLSGRNLSLKPGGYGLETLTVTAKDARGAQCELIFRVLVRDCSKSVDIYPIPVSDVLYVRPGTEVYTDATLISKAGAQVMHQAGKVGPFEPLSINVASLPAGSYTLKLFYGSETVVTSIVKY